jgi:alpha-glucosidase
MLAVMVVTGPDASCFGNTISSPNGQIAVRFRLQENGVPAYDVDYLGKPLVGSSRLGFEPEWTSQFEVTNVSLDSSDQSWTQDYGERKVVPDRYNEMIVQLRQASGRRLQVQFRAYDEGAALRYVLPVGEDAGELQITAEKTEFRLPDATWGYEEHGTEGEYKRALVADFEPQCERPLTLELADGRFASLTEAGNERFPRMLISPLEGVPGALVTALGGTTSNGVPRAGLRDDGRNARATLQPGESTPWRVFIVGSSPGQLLERNYLVLNLSRPSVLADTTWIKPGKVMRDTRLTTANSKAIIDFAPAAGLDYVLLDARWYGSEDAATGDATTARAPNLDVAEIIRYGREKNVRLILYVDRRQLRRQRDEIFPLYEKWGVAGVKLGFVDVGPQRETEWLTKTIAKAAEHRLMLNIHDGFRATGLQRTYPNLMTVEGIRGNEQMPTARHNCTLPFTRYITGCGDYTICYYDRRIKTTHAHQLAMMVVSYSPLQWIFWYDRPEMFGGEPEIEFFRECPTVWDETRVIHGRIGEYATIARKSGDVWFVGTINANERRTLRIPLDFLEPGRTYQASLYSDDETINTRTKVRVDRREVVATTVIEAPLADNGGQAIWIRPLR